MTTDQGLIHTYEIVPVVQFLRKRTAEQRETKGKKNMNRISAVSDVGMVEK
jgi:hypothetical protein